MNSSKLLYVATVAVSLIASSVAMADEAPVTRAQVNAGVQQARADGSLQRTDYDLGSYRPQAVSAGTTRAQVSTDLAQAQADRRAMVGPQANRRYHEYATQIFTASTLTRSDVKSEVLAAAANGTLQRTDYDDAALVARKVNQHAAAARFAQRFKAKSARTAG